MYTSATVLHVRVVLKRVESETRDAAAWVASRGVEFAVAGGHGFLPRIWRMSLIVEEDH
jgi:hypothetical protein